MLLSTYLIPSLLEVFTFLCLCVPTSHSFSSIENSPLHKNTVPAKYPGIDKVLRFLQFCASPERAST